MTSANGSTRRLVRICVLLFLVAGAAGVGLWFASGGRAAFRRSVIHPIPRSVHNIRADHLSLTSFWRWLHGFRGHAAILRFDIRREDLPQIIAAHQLKAWKTVRYTDDGRLEYEIVYSGVAGIAEIDLYWGRRREAPHWFDLKEWTDFETYFAVNEGRFGPKRDRRRQVTALLFNEQLSSAYFIMWEAVSP